MIKVGDLVRTRWMNKGRIGIVLKIDEPPSRASGYARATIHMNGGNMHEYLIKDLLKINGDKDGKY